MAYLPGQGINLTKLSDLDLENFLKRAFTGLNSCLIKPYNKRPSRVINFLYFGQSLRISSKVSGVIEMLNDHLFSPLVLRKQWELEELFNEIGASEQLEKFQPKNLESLLKEAFPTSNKYSTSLDNIRFCWLDIKICFPISGEFSENQPDKDKWVELIYKKQLTIEALKEQAEQMKGGLNSG